jgi:dihydrofolate synthase/folylpolyglutamate synthase
VAQKESAGIKEALDWLFSNTNYEQKPTFRYNTRTFNVERTERMLQLLDYPHLAYPTLHIAGTKGKGSTSAMCAAILQAAGADKVGLYTSPHLMELEERIAVNFEPISEAALLSCLSAVHGPVEEVTALGMEWKPTFFEIFTAVGFLHFAREKADAGVIEVGLGGRLDATNAVRPVVTGITPISYDHTAILGETLDAIAREKAGIIKEGVPLVVGRQDKEALDAILEVADKVGAAAICLDRDYRVTRDADGTFAVRTPHSRYEGLKLPLLGEHQRYNAGMAITMSEIAARRLGLAMTQDTVRQALAGLVWPGRVEVWSERPPVVIDAAHNAASARALVEAVRERWPGEKAVVVFAIAQHKDGEGVIEELAKIAREFVVTTIDSPRSTPVEELGAAVKAKTGVPTRVVAERPEALRVGRELADGGLLVITGSFYLAGELREILVRERKAGGA